VRSHASFLQEFALVCGSDYYTIGHGVGAVKTVAILQSYANITGPRAESYVTDVKSLAKHCVDCLSSKAVRDLDISKTLDMQGAHCAFQHYLHYDPIRKIVDYANSDVLIYSLDFIQNVVGPLPLSAELAVLRVLGLVLPTGDHVATPSPVTQIHRNGDVLPAVLQEWMVPGSRPSCLPADAIHDDLIAELKLNSLSTDGTPQECIARAELHAITVRKPAQTLTAEECISFLRCMFCFVHFRVCCLTHRAREISPLGTKVGLLRDQIASKMAEQQDPQPTVLAPVDMKRTFPGFSLDLVVLARSNSVFESATIHHTLKFNATTYVVNSKLSDKVQQQQLMCGPIGPAHFKAAIRLNSRCQ